MGKRGFVALGVEHAHVMNNHMDFRPFDDPREKALRDALYRSIETISS